ncbi:MAG: protein jag [Spirochaetaceae bacterium]|jgi:spoIIIJ-associated protein|nr:protein jag [Spirochaetaceae bacterium]
MVKEFEGRTEKEAIDKAAAELGLERDCFDVEIVEVQRGGLFKKSYAKIRVHTSDSIGGYSEKQRKSPPVRQRSGETQGEAVPPDEEFETKIIEYSDKLMSLMGIDGKTSVMFREKRKLGLNIASTDSSFIIGKKGKTLDALQLIISIYTMQLGRNDMRILLDCENYRVRREENLVKTAYSVAARVRESRSSILLEPMNPFDRRLVHTALSDLNDIDTKSEGQGQYKQVRVFYKGPRR